MLSTIDFWSFLVILGSKFGKNGQKGVAFKGVKVSKISVFWCFSAVFGLFGILSDVMKGVITYDFNMYLV